MRKALKQAGRMLAGAALMAAAALPAHALMRMTLRSGVTWDCVRLEPAGDRVRVYTNEESYIEIKAAEIVRVDEFAPVAPAAAPVPPVVASPAVPAKLTKTELAEMLATAGQRHNIDADLLASIVMAESGGQPRAVSRVGAQGLMQLMPGTAREMNVTDSFQPQQNIAGGAGYLDAMLTRYHDNLALAVAAYNAGPGAVDRYRGVPPYRETRAYVARVIRDFNRRKTIAEHTRLAAERVEAAHHIPGAAQPGPDTTQPSPQATLPVVQIAGLQ